MMQLKGWMRKRTISEEAPQQQQRGDKLTKAARTQQESSPLALMPSQFLRRGPKRQKKVQSVIQIYTSDRDGVTGDEENLSALFYEEYRGYTIYSNARGICCIHGQQGCLRLQGQFVSFLKVEDAKDAINYFRARKWTAHQSMDRMVGEEPYLYIRPLDVHSAV